MCGVFVYIYAQISQFIKNWLNINLINLKYHWNILSDPVIRDKFSKHGRQGSYELQMSKESDIREFAYKRLILSAPNGSLMYTLRMYY